MIEWETTSELLGLIRQWLRGKYTPPPGTRQFFKTILWIKEKGLFHEWLKDFHIK